MLGDDPRSDLDVATATWPRLAAPSTAGLADPSQLRERRCHSLGVVQPIAGGPFITSVRQVGGVQVEVQPDGRVANTFAFPGPDDGPVSYEGRLMSIQWRIEVQINLAQRSDEKLHVPLLVVPRGGSGIYKRAHPLRRQDYPRP